MSPPAEIAEMKDQSRRFGEVISTALATLPDTLEDRVQTLCGGIVRRFTTLPRLNSVIASAAAAATMWSAAAHAQSGPGAARPSAAAPLRLSAATPARPSLAGTQLNSTQQTDPMLARLDNAIDINSRRYLTANSHSPWQIFHGLLALRRDMQLIYGTSKVNAIEWIATQEPKFDGQPLLMKTQWGGKFHAFTRPYAFEGHPAQFLALMSQSDLPVTYRFKVGREFITISDIINNTMKEVNTREEVTWVLWALQHYLPTNAQWVNQYSEAWSIERLVQIETDAPVIKTPCGGNHRLFALTRTRDKYLKTGGSLVGIWAQADHKIRQHIEIARSLQNSDGSFSAKFYEQPGFTSDMNERFNTTGHTMEFLSIALPDDRLKDPWVQNAVTMLCNELVANRQREISCGPLYHTLNSLIIYRERYRAHLATTSPVPALLEHVPAMSMTALAAVPSLLTIPVPVAIDPNAPVVVKPLVEPNRLEAKPVSRDPNAEPVSPQKPAEVAAKPSTPMPIEKPSEDALNELKLDKETRDLLESLLIPGKHPGEMPKNAEARPLESTGQPLLHGNDEPASALSPANQ